MTMDTVPEDQRVYKSCIYPVACIIIVMYVDNNGVPQTTPQLVQAPSPPCARPPPIPWA